MSKAKIDLKLKKDIVKMLFEEIENVYFEDINDFDKYAENVENME